MIHFWYKTTSLYALTTVSRYRMPCSVVTMLILRLKIIMNP